MLGAPSSRDLRGRLPAVAWTSLLAVALAIGPLAPIVAADDPTPSPTATPSPTPSPSPPPLTVTYRLSLLRPGDFTRQYTGYQCVGASLQTMRNIIWTRNNRSRALQRRLWTIARRNSLYKADGGADPFGWTVATGRTGQGRYVLVAAPTMSQAVKAAAHGMATTGRPAGIIVWRGAHAWVLTGFEATADPGLTDDFHVLAVRMADPLWPYFHVRRRNIYRPGTRLGMGTLRRNFTPYHDGRLDPRIEGRFVAIVPVADGDPIPTGAWSPSTPAPAAAPSPAPAPTPAPSPSPASGAANGTDGSSGGSGPTPTPSPTAGPTEAPTASPEATPSPEPTAQPTATPEPSPSEAPSVGP